MHVYVGQDFYGNVYVTDNRDSLSPELTEFFDCELPERDRHDEDAALSLSFERWGLYKDVEVG